MHWYCNSTHWSLPRPPLRFCRVQTPVTGSASPGFSLFPGTWREKQKVLPGNSLSLKILPDLVPREVQATQSVIREDFHNLCEELCCFPHVDSRSACLCLPSLACLFILSVRHLFAPPNLLLHLSPQPLAEIFWPIATCFLSTDAADSDKPPLRSLCSGGVREGGLLWKGAGNGQAGGQELSCLQPEGR